MSGRSPVSAAGGRTTSPLVIHVVADQSAVEGRGCTPASVAGAGWLIPAEVVAELAENAKLQPLAPPGGAEPHYSPSAKLAAFVRARDLTWRARDVNAQLNSATLTTPSTTATAEPPTPPTSSVFAERIA
jgi:hypothetical protein